MCLLLDRLFFAFLFTTCLVNSQTVIPGPTHDCSSQFVYDGSLACNNDVHNCCGPTETCCRGGCCSVSEVCVFQGTAQEACCPLGASGNCGYNPYPSSTPTGPCTPRKPYNIPCSGADSSWYCNAACSCNVAVAGACNCFGTCSGDASSSAAPIATSTSGVVEPSSSSEEAASSTEEAPSSTSTDEVTSTTGEPVSSTTVEESSSPTAETSSTSEASNVSIQTQTSIAGGGAATQSSTAGSGTTTSRAGSGSSTTPAAAGTSTSSAGGAGLMKIEGLPALVLAVLGWVVPGLL